ncbi:unnamed protein product [Amaranthus hypochondriacus]
MPKVSNISDTKSLSDKEDESQMQKVDTMGFGITSEVVGLRHLGENVASSSGTNLRSSFIGMGFSPSLIDKVIKEKGEEDADLLLDTLFAYSAHQKSNSESSDSLGPMLDENTTLAVCEVESHMEKALHGTKSVSTDSLDSLLDDDKDVKTITTADPFPKQELDLVEDLDDDKRASLLLMNFPIAKVDFAIDKLGKSAQIDELVDFIIAAEIAESENCDNPPNASVNKNEDCSAEALFGTMDKTLRLLEMGFDEHEVSLAIEKLGSEVPVIELANCICASQMGESYRPSTKNGPVSSKTKRASLDGSWYHIKGVPSHCGDILAAKTEKLDEEYWSSLNLGNADVGMKPKEEYYDESNSFMKDFTVDDIKGKRPKEEYEEDLSICNGHAWKRSKVLSIGNNPSPHRKTPVVNFEMPSRPNASGKSVDNALYGPPYFLYGNFVNLSADGWKKVSQFLFSLHPEFVNTQLFSALNRTEGYIHNLPIEDRSHIEPKSPMTIEDVIPHTKKFWPSWDTRKQLNCISSDTTGASQVCNSLGKMLAGSRGAPSSDQQTKVLYYCRTMNLVWVGPQKLSPMEPEYLERIMGYPTYHTRNPDMTLADRLDSLKNCFQTDTIGYYLSVLKSLFPGGVTVLSLYSGIGGAEVALHRLGIYMKAVVSVESSEARRKVLRRWWQNTDQSGELVQIENIQRLTSNKLEFLIKKFGGFDLVVCLNPCTYEKASNVVPGSRETVGLDFTSYYEFVRVLQRVRTMSGRT